jgi:phage terminase small subunit
MDEKLITDMSTEEFDAVIDAYIERETKDMGELDAPLFYDALRGMLATDAEDDTVEVEGEIVDNQLVLKLPADFDQIEQMQDIAILVGGRRITIRLKDDKIYPTVH